ncbi:hypothetical protein F4703DRAFT_1403841 [Phycomyces blakesleeanus]
MASPKDITAHGNAAVDQTIYSVPAKDSGDNDMAINEQSLTDATTMDLTGIVNKNPTYSMEVNESSDDDLLDNQISELDDPAAIQAQKTLEALEQLPQVMEQLDQDNTRFELHVRLIEILSLLDFPDQLESARENMHELFPLPESMWLDWINDAKKNLDTEDGEAKLRLLYNEAEKDYLFLCGFYPRQI